MPKPLPRASKKGFDLPGERAHVLLFHGYTGSPYDLRALGDTLNAEGFHVVAPLFKGHGKKPSDLFLTTAEDWLLEAEEIFLTLDSRKPIVIAGLSMGALVATLLAAHFPARGLLLFSPSFRLNLSAELTIAAAQLGFLDKNFSLKKLSGGSDVADPIAKKRTPAYLEMPVAGLLQFERLRMLAKAKIADVQCPLFLAFGRNDGAINVADSNRVVLEHSAQPVFSKVYENSKHIVTLDYDREQLFGDVLQFLTHQLGI